MKSFLDEYGHYILTLEHDGEPPLKIQVRSLYSEFAKEIETDVKARFKRALFELAGEL